MNLKESLGWNYNPSNIILNRRFNLKIASMMMFDAARVYVHDGLADTELGQMMKVFHSNKCKTSFKELGEYVSTFTFPKNAPSLKHLFTASANKHNSKNGSFTCTGSEFLTLAPVLKRYLQKVVRPRGQFTAHVDSMLAVLRVLELTQAVKTGTVNWKDLDKAIVTHLELYKSCYGANKFRPKHHYALHLGPMLKHHGFLLMTFTHERKHRLVVRYTRDRRNLKAWDAGAIEEITCHQLWELSEPFWGVCNTAKPRGTILIPLKEMFPGVSDDCFTILNGVNGNGGSINSGDVVSCVHLGIALGLSLLPTLVYPYSNPRTGPRDDWTANNALLGLHNWAYRCTIVALQPCLIESAVLSPPHLTDAKRVQNGRRPKGNKQK